MRKEDNVQRLYVDITINNLPESDELCSPQVLKLMTILAGIEGSLAPNCVNTGVSAIITTVIPITQFGNFKRIFGKTTWKNDRPEPL
jgi:hypothetical protein